MKRNSHHELSRFLWRVGLIGLAAFLIIPLISYAPAQAIESVVCTPTADADFDGDGFSDAEEEAGLELGGQFYSPCVDPADTAARGSCLDPASADAFIEVKRDEPSLLPDDPLVFLKEGHASKTFHVLPSGTLGSERILLQRNDGTCQKAVKVVEERTFDGDCYVILGRTLGIGPPNNDLGPAVIYTDRIECFINTKMGCDAGKDCSNGLGAQTAAEIIHDQILNTVAHEGGHRYQLGPVFNSRFGGWHYKAGAGVMMEQANKVTARKNYVIFYTSDDFSDPSIAGAALK